MTTSMYLTAASIALLLLSAFSVLLVGCLFRADKAIAHVRAERDSRGATADRLAKKLAAVNIVDPTVVFFAKQNKHGDWYWGFSHNDISITALKKYDSFNAAEARVRQVFPGAHVERR